ncbi:unnamed protein product [Paramecium primaurelia]|uniref:Splicing factor Cactin n=2 Tax=Paramecium TaxID=5884 RepID=A0A8S1UKZ4_9CILI|nr:unnamed protein product [Paramecium primaurelia]CAD8164817.1 unnamed protein product [Paramecium pentaurelia]
MTEYLKKRQANESSSASSAESLSFSSSSSSPSSSSSSQSRSRSSRKHQQLKKYQKSSKMQTKNQLLKAYASLDKMKQKYLQKIGYTDQDNPYGDKNLAKSLIWKSKLDEKGLHGISEHELKEKLDDMLKEIEKLKSQRQKKQEEKIKLEEEKNRLNKERQMENYKQWIDNEDAFFEKVEKLRPLIRIQQQRELPFDKFVRICCIYKGQIGHQKQLEQIMHNPSQFIKTLGHEAQKVILNESKKQFAIEIDNKSNFQDYWASIISIAQAEVEWREQREKDPKCPKFGIQSEFKQDIKKMFEGKSREGLDELEGEINQMLNYGAEYKIDFDYWEKILKKLKVIKAKTILKNYYEVFCKELKYKSMRQDNQLVLDVGINTKDIQINVERNATEKQYYQVEIQEQTEYECVSPDPVDCDDYILENDDLKQLTDQRITILTEFLNNAKIELEKQQLKKKKEKEKEKEKQKGKQNKLPEFSIPNNRKLEDNVEGLDILAQQMFEYERSKPLEEDEVYFNEVVPQRQEPSWSQKYKLKRPQYFNRVKMGFDWNMYNKTHYDVDNPPPKTIQGYKFNVFYPELIDKTQAPKYTLETCENPDYCIIRFIAGPPYEDLAFQILCKEWDYSDRMGFKSVFSRGILHLWFNFKKPRYRR